VSEEYIPAWRIVVFIDWSRIKSGDMLNVTNSMADPEIMQMADKYGT